MSDSQAIIGRLSRKPNVFNKHLDVLRTADFDGLKFCGDHIIVWTEKKRQDGLHAYKLDEAGDVTRLWSKELKKSEGHFYSHWVGQFLNGETMLHVHGMLYDVKNGENIGSFPSFKNEFPDFVFKCGDGDGYYGIYSYVVEENDKRIVRYALGFFDENFHLIAMHDEDVFYSASSKIVAGKMYGSVMGSLKGQYYYNPVFCVDLKTSEKLWSFDCLPLRVDPEASLVIELKLAGDDLVFAVDAVVVVLDAATGQLRHAWDLRNNNQILSAFSFKEGNRISFEKLLIGGELCVLQCRLWDPYYNDNIAALVVMNYRTGEVLWSRSGSPVWQLALAGDDAFFCVQDFYPVAFAMKDGRELWRAAKQTSAGGRFVIWSNGRLCVWSDINDCFEIYLPLPEGVSELITTINVQQLEQKLRDALMSKVSASSRPLLERAIAISTVSAYKFNGSKPYGALAAADLPLAMELTEILLAYYPDLDDPEGCVHETLRILCEEMLEHKAVLKFELINKAARAGCDGYVTSMLMELAALTSSKKREAFYKWALKKSANNDYVFDAFERIHGRDGI